MLCYKLDIFEGPLDLLLNLILKNKINICDIEIVILVEQYMSHIERMRETNMEIASEFLDMASRLIYIKSVMLLPKHDDEAESLKQELTGQLIEYQKCKEAAKEMSLLVNFDTFVKQAEDVEFDLTYDRKHSLGELIDAFISAAGRGKRRLPPSEKAFSGIVSKKIISVGTKIIYIMRTLWLKNSIKYSELFQKSREKSELVATFLAVLELIKGKRVKITDDQDTAEIYMVKDRKL